MGKAQTSHSSVQRVGATSNISRFESLVSTNPVAITDFSYDSANRLGGITHQQGATTLQTFAYGYDKLSRLTSFNTLQGLNSYTYDQRSQVKSEQNSFSSASGTYDYDANGNRSGTGYVIGADNRIVSAPCGQEFQYDDEGNLTYWRENSSDAWSYVWDHRNRLVSATKLG